METSDYAKYLSGKKVVLVGPAPSIVGTKQGSDIDSFDVIIRLNHALPVPEGMEEDIGTKTNVLYSTLKRKSLYWNFPWLKENLDVVVFPYSSVVEPWLRYIGEFDEARGDVEVPLLIACKDDTEEQLIEQMVGARPTIGLAAIIHLCSFEIESLYITGLTFFKKSAGNTGGYYEAYKNQQDYDGEATEEKVLEFVRRCGVHEPNLELKFMKGLKEKYPHITCDPGLNEALEKWRS